MEVVRTKRKLSLKHVEDKPDKKRKSNVAIKVEPSPDAPTAVEAVANKSAMENLLSNVEQWVQDQKSFVQSAEAILPQDEICESSDQQEYVPALDLTLRELSKYSDEEKRKSYKFECEWRQCKFLSGNDRKYFEHVDTHSENLEVNSDDTFVCEWDLCDFVTESRDELIGHVHFHGYHTMLKVHGASLSLLANLPRCNLDSRMRNSIGNRPMTYICDWDSCHERFNKAMYFFYHVKNHLIDAYPQGRKSGYRGEKVMCRWSNCKIGYNALTTMKIHIRAHTTEREVACFCCGTMFRERLKYLDHCARQVDVSYRKYQCLQCGKFCTTDRLLKNHMDTHYKEYECTLCPIGFSSKAALSTHIMRRHFQVRNYKCQQCDYRAFTKADLMVHTLSHNARKLYRCDEFGCNVAFKTETSLKKHISWHYNLPTPMYECHLCSNKYAQSFHLSKHYLFDHKLERQPGYRTYRYKIDSDGIHRLAWYVEKKTQDCVKPSIEQLEAQSTMKHKSASNPPVEKSKPSKSTYAALKGVPQVECIKSIGVDEFLVELKLIEEPKDESEKTGQEEQSKFGDLQITKPLVNDVHGKVKQHISDESASPSLQLKQIKETKSSTKGKKVQDFTIMRYLNPKRKTT